jgi:hypothetical protein
MSSKMLQCQLVNSYQHCRGTHPTLLDPEDGGTTILRNTAIYLPVSVA